MVNNNKQSALQKTYPRYGLYLVGSTISGFGSDSSDVDMCLVSRFITDMEPRSEAVMHLTHLKEHLENTTGNIMLVNF